MFKRFFKLALVIIFLLEVNTINIYAHDDIEIIGESAILIEETTKKILYEKNSYQKMYPASLTKILTAMILLEYFDKDDIIVTGYEVNEIPIDSSKAGNFVGESLSVHNIVRGLIIPSGNETANVVAVAVAKEETGKETLTFEEAQKIFADIMNKKAKEVGAVNSNFINAHGYHHDDHYTTAYDMALIAIEAMKSDLIREIVSEVYFEGYGVDTNDENLKTQIYKWPTHNLLLNSKAYGYEYATGMKTGFTDQAGYSLAASAQKDDKKLIAIVLFSDSSSRWTDAIQLFDYGFDNFSFQTVQKENEVLVAEELSNTRLGTDEEDLEIIGVDEFIGFLENDIDRVNRIISYHEQYILEHEDDLERISLKTPINKGDILGTVKYELDGEVIFTGNVISSRDVLARDFKSDFKYYLKVSKEVCFSIQAIPFWIFGIISVVSIIRGIREINLRRRRKFYRNKRKLK